MILSIHRQHYQILFYFKYFIAFLQQSPENNEQGSLNGGGNGNDNGGNSEKSQGEDHGENNVTPSRGKHPGSPRRPGRKLPYINFRPHFPPPPPPPPPPHGFRPWPLDEEVDDFDESNREPSNEVENNN